MVMMVVVAWWWSGWVTVAAVVEFDAVGGYGSERNLDRCW
jgi:hypothetical protein